jgi:hypothetical protein
MYKKECGAHCGAKLPAALLGRFHAVDLTYCRRVWWFCQRIISPFISRQRLDLQSSCRCSVSLLEVLQDGEVESTKVCQFHNNNLQTQSDVPYRLACHRSVYPTTSSCRRYSSPASRRRICVRRTVT